MRVWLATSRAIALASSVSSGVMVGCGEAKSLMISPCGRLEFKIFKQLVPDVPQQLRTQSTLDDLGQSADPDGMDRKFSGKNVSEET